MGTTGPEPPAGLSKQHYESLTIGSGISRDVIISRGYRTIATADDLIGLQRLGFGDFQCLVGLLIPLHTPNGQQILSTLRPDIPQLDKRGKRRKYEFPTGCGMRLDVPPLCREDIDDPKVPLYITEGAKKADSLASRGLCALAVAGVWNWKGKNEKGGTTFLADWDYVHLKGRTVYVVFDSDVMTRPEVSKALDRLTEHLKAREAHVHRLYLPQGGNGKVGVDDYFVAGGTAEGLILLTKPEPKPDAEPEPEPKKPAPEPRPTFAPITLAQAVEIFSKWLKLKTADELYVLWASVIANLLPGDPVWLLTIAPPSSGKTEAIRALDKLEHIFPVATLTEASLLSGTSKRERPKDASGGLLKEIGAFGILAVKDFGSILSLNKDTRAPILQALREVYDGSWVRYVGTDGGRTLEWHGKVGLVGGSTGAIDNFHAVISILGDRFVLFRPVHAGGVEMAKQAMSHVLQADVMRKALAEAVGGLFAGMDMTAPRTIQETEIEWLANLACFTALGRAAVMRDPYTREIDTIPGSEGTPRLALAFAKMLQAFDILGLEQGKAYDLVAAIARDTIPPNRLQAWEYLSESGQDANRSTTEVAYRLSLPTTTARRSLEELAVYGLALRVEKEEGQGNVDRWQLTPEGVDMLAHTVERPRLELNL